MKHTFVFLATILLIVSCKKKTEEMQPCPTEPVNNYEMPTTVGSYWVYHWDAIDSNGVASATAISDTNRIIGDTLIHNNVFIVFEGSILQGQKIRWYERDSSGYIINSNGHIVCAYSSSPTEFYQNPASPFLFRYGVDSPGSITVPAGSYQNTIRMYENISRLDGQQLTVCGDQDVSLYDHFVSGIGLVSKETAYYSQLQFQCKKMRSKLVTYYIAP